MARANVTQNEKEQKESRAKDAKGECRRKRNKQRDDGDRCRNTDRQARNTAEENAPLVDAAAVAARSRKTRSWKMAIFYLKLSSYIF